MAVNLTAVFKLRDEGSSKLRKVLQAMEKMQGVSKKLDSATKSTNAAIEKTGSIASKVGTQFNSARSKLSAFNTGMNNVKSSATTANSSLSGMQSTLLGIAGAYLTAHGAAKAFESTIGAAAKFEQANVTLNAMINDDELSKQYLSLIDKIAIDSPLLNSSDMVSGSKGLLSLTKNIDDLSQSWKTAEKLIALNPDKSIDDVVRSMKELASADITTMKDIFNIDKNALNAIKDLSFSQQLDELDKILEKMNMTDKVVEAMGDTTLGQWNSLKERASTFFRDIGKESNSKLGGLIKQFNDMFSGLDTAKFSNAIGGVLSETLDKIISVGKFLWKWREPILAVAKVVGIFVGALAGILAISGTIAAIGAAISFITSPIGLIVAGITAAIVGFKALYDNSESFRNAINGIVTQIKAIWSAFKTGDTSGLEGLFPPGITDTISGIITKVRELFGAFQNGGIKGVLEMLLPAETINALMARFATLKEQFMSVFTSIVGYVVPVLQTAWSLVSPILSALWNALKIVADVAMIAWNNILAPAISFVMKAFQMMWSVVGPVLELLGAMIKAAFAVLRIVWDTVVGPFVAFMAGVFTQVMGAATEIVKALSPVFETLGGWIKFAAEWISKLADWISNIKVPDWIGKLGGGAVEWAQKLIPGNYHGLREVVSNGQLSYLHKGEAVLPRQEAEAYRSIVSPGGSLATAFSGVSYEETSAGIPHVYNNSSTYNTTTAPEQTSSRPSVINVTIPKYADRIAVEQVDDIPKLARQIAEYTVDQILTRQPIRA